MSVADDWNISKLHETSVHVSHTPPSRHWHRIAEVRRQQGISLRSLTRKMGLTIDEIRNQEEPTTDLSISQLAAWQKALEVPLASLLLDLDAPLSGPVLTRAQMLRAMKTVQAIKEGTRDTSIQRMATMLGEQLIDVMPELKEVTAWHSVGQRRTQDEVGRIAERPISDNFIQDALH